MSAYSNKFRDKRDSNMNLGERENSYYLSDFIAKLFI